MVTRNSNEAFESDSAGDAIGRHLAGQLIDRRMPSDGGTFTWAHMVWTGQDELSLIVNTTGAVPRLNLATGEHGPIHVQGDFQVIATLTVDAAHGLAKLLEVDSEGELAELLRAGVAQAIEQGA
jgi:hypothetical protein